MNISMKKSFLLFLLLSVIFLCGCSNNQQEVELLKQQNSMLQQQVEQQQQIEQQKQADATNFSDYSDCVSIAQEEYYAKKDTYCRNLFNNLENMYNDCVVNKQKEKPTNELGSTWSSADWIWRHADGTPIQNYTLNEATELCKEAYNRWDNVVYNPDCTNISLDDALEREKDRCVELYK